MTIGFRHVIMMKSFWSFFTMQSWSVIAYFCYCRQFINTWWQTFVFPECWVRPDLSCLIWRAVIRHAACQYEEILLKQFENLTGPFQNFRTLFLPLSDPLRSGVGPFRPFGALKYTNVIGPGMNPPHKYINCCFIFIFLLRNVGPSQKIAGQIRWAFIFWLEVPGSPWNLTPPGEILATPPNTYVVLFQLWHDSRLTWQPSDHGDTYVVLMHSWEIWLPDIVLMNGWVATNSAVWCGTQSVCVCFFISQN